MLTAMKVALILDQEADEHLLAGANAYWLIASPANRALAMRLAATGAYDANSAVFDGTRYSGVEDAAVGILDNIDEHHPEWTGVEVAGVELTNALAALLVQNGRKATRLARGFVVTRG